MINNFYLKKVFSIQCTIYFIVSFIFTCSNAALAADNYAIYKEEISQLKEIEKGKSRLVFYGTNYGWYGLAAGGEWKPLITINGRDLNAPNGRNIYFVVDIPEGEYEIRTVYPKNFLEKSTYGVPYYHDITQGYTLRALSGETYYHEMTISSVRTNESFFHNFDYFLSLWRVESDSATPLLERMTHWLKSEFEEESLTTEDKEQQL